MEEKIKELKSLCDNNGLKLYNPNFLGLLRKCWAKDNPENFDFRCTLEIPKESREITYEQIYKMVNSIQVCRFEKV